MWRISEGNGEIFILQSRYMQSTGNLKSCKTLLSVIYLSEWRGVVSTPPNPTLLRESHSLPPFYCCFYAYTLQIIIIEKMAGWVVSLKKTTYCTFISFFSFFLFKRFLDKYTDPTNIFQCFSNIPTSYASNGDLFCAFVLKTITLVGILLRVSSLILSLIRTAKYRSQ